MRFKILGSAAGGGFPQWNCFCSNCQGVRSGRMQATPRLQSSLAVAADEGDQWVLVNASPDVRQQIQNYLPPPPHPPVRWSPIHAVILTDSQIDHTGGLLLLREARERLQIYATQPVQVDLTSAFPVMTMLGAYAGVDYQALPINGDSFRIAGLPGIKITAIPLDGVAPPYSPQRGHEAVGANIALAFTDDKTGKSALYAPGLKELNAVLRAFAAASDLLLVDGSFWRDDEMVLAGAGSRRALQMGHLPLSGSDGLLQQLGFFPKARRVLVHINNTNPILDEQSAERLATEALGVEVGFDGMEFQC